jgi:hypothetical protein
MKKPSVTSELKKIVGELGIQYKTTFSDYLPKDRVSVKFSGAYFTDEQKEIVKSKMEEKGFVFQFVKESIVPEWSAGSLWDGTRFCFTKIL